MAEKFYCQSIQTENENSIEELTKGLIRGLKKEFISLNEVVIKSKWR